MLKKQTRKDRVVVGINEVLIQGFNAVEAYVGREDHTVNHIILGIGGIGGMIGLVEQPAGRHGRIESKSKPLREAVFLQQTGRPEILMLIGVDLFCPGAVLVEVTCSKAIVPLLILIPDKVQKLLHLGKLAFTVIIRFQMKIDEHKLFVAPLHRQI